MPLGVEAASCSGGVRTGWSDFLRNHTEFPHPLPTRFGATLESGSTLDRWLTSWSRAELNVCSFVAQVIGDGNAVLSCGLSDHLPLSLELTVRLRNQRPRILAPWIARLPSFEAEASRLCEAYRLLSLPCDTALVRLKAILWQTAHLARQHAVESVALRSEKLLVAKAALRGLRQPAWGGARPLDRGARLALQVLRGPGRALPLVQPRGGYRT